MSKYCNRYNTIREVVIDKIVCGCMAFKKVMRMRKQILVRWKVRKRNCVWDIKETKIFISGLGILAFV